MKNLFLYRLFLFDKRLFFVLTGFCTLTIVSNISGHEVTPFFIWAMYSEEEIPVNNYEVFKIQVNDSLMADYPAGFTNVNRFYLTAPLSYYKKLKQNNFKEPTLTFIKERLGSRYQTLLPVVNRVFQRSQDTSQFINWYKNYLEQSTGRPVYNLRVEVVHTHYDLNQRIRADSSYPLLQWR